MKINPLQALHPNLDYITSADSFFATVKEEFPNYRKTGLFKKRGKEAVYIYQIRTLERNYTGLLACADIQEYVDNNIKKHENTLASKEQQQIHLLLLRQAQVKPILLACRSNPDLKSFVVDNLKDDKILYSIYFEEEESTHVFYEISDWKQIQRLQDIFENTVPTTYIADGHHRFAAQSTMSIKNMENKENSFSNILCAFFPANELQIWDFNRIVDAFEDLSPSLFMAKLSQIFEIKIEEEPRKPTQKHEIIMLTKSEVFSLTWRPEILEEYKKETILLDVKILNDKVLTNILGIEDIKTDTRIRYIDGIAGVEGVREKVIKNDNRIGFILFPVQMDDFMNISDKGMVLPPKSTWFEPRMKNGLIVQEF